MVINDATFPYHCCNTNVLNLFVSCHLGELGEAELALFSIAADHQSYPSPFNPSLSVALSTYSYSGDTPLHLAVQTGDDRLIQLLLEHGADMLALRAASCPLEVEDLGTFRWFKHANEGWKFPSNAKDVKLNQRLDDVDRVPVKKDIEIDWEWDSTIFGPLPHYLPVPPRRSIPNSSPLSLALQNANLKAAAVMLKEWVRRGLSIHDCPLVSAELLQVFQGNFNLLEPSTSTLDIHFAALGGHLSVIENSGKKIGMRDAKRRNVAHIAAGRGHVRILQYIAQAAPELLTSRDAKGRQPLHFAVNACQYETFLDDFVLCVQILLENGCDPLSKGEDCENAITEALKAGSCEIFKSLATHIEGWEANGHISNDGQPALLVAAANGHFELFKALVAEYGADPFAVDSHGRNVLILSALNGSKDLVRHILEELPGGKDLLNRVNEEGFTPLIAAVANSRYEIVDILCNASADVNLCKGSSSPLCLAASLGSLQIVKRLVSAGADVNVPIDLKDELKIPVRNAAIYGHDHIAEFLFGLMTSFNLSEAERSDIRDVHASIRQLFDLACKKGNVNLLAQIMKSGWINPRSPIPNQIDFGKTNPLADAVASGSLEMVEYILDETPFGPHLSNRRLKTSHKTPLTIAATLNPAIATKIAKRLLLAEARPTVFDAEGNGVAHIASSFGNVEILKLLKDSIDFNEPGKAGYTPLMFSVLNGHAEVVSLLVNAGASVEKLFPQNWIANFKPSRRGLIALASFIHEEMWSELNVSTITNAVLRHPFGDGDEINTFVNPLNGQSLLHRALEDSNERVWNIIKKKCGGKLNMESRNHEGWTPVTVGVLKGHLRIASNVSREIFYRRNIYRNAFARNDKEQSNKPTFQQKHQIRFFERLPSDLISKIILHVSAPKSFISSCKRFYELSKAPSLRSRYALLDPNQAVLSALLLLDFFEQPVCVFPLKLLRGQAEALTSVFAILSEAKGTWANERLRQVVWQACKVLEICDSFDVSEANSWTPLSCTAAIAFATSYDEDLAKDIAAKGQSVKSTGVLVGTDWEFFGTTS
ncbi:hypothetical protein HDU97_000867 [Phlyctochytrium planicorne]|nr:hypothetical protein HDU97_000867 [Phlyctochytrium planicorne]